MISPEMIESFKNLDPNIVNKLYIKINKLKG